jgi:tetratricopeptide (TPR) repeat protein
MIQVKALSFFLMAFGMLAADAGQGIDLFRKGKFAQAEESLRAFVSAEPENARARRYLGMALVSQNKLAEAAEMLNRAQEQEPGPESQTALAHLYIAQKDFEKAESALSEGKGEEAEFARGLLALHRKQSGEAARHFESVLEANPENSYAHYHAGMAYNGLKRKDKMLTHFELFLRMNPDAPEARKVRAVLRTAN